MPGLIRIGTRKILDTEEMNKFVERIFFGSNKKSKKPRPTLKHKTICKTFTKISTTMASKIPLISSIDVSLHRLTKIMGFPKPERVLGTRSHFIELIFQHNTRVFAFYNSPMRKTWLS